MLHQNVTGTAKRDSVGHGRLPRFDLAGVPQYVVQRVNNRLPCFRYDEDRQRYPDAAHHRPHHAATYHLTVFYQLSRATEVESGRVHLRSIKSQLLSGVLTL